MPKVGRKRQCIDNEASRRMNDTPSPGPQTVGPWLRLFERPRAWLYVLLYGLTHPATATPPRGTWRHSREINLQSNGIITQLWISAQSTVSQDK